MATAKQATEPSTDGALVLTTGVPQGGRVSLMSGRPYPKHRGACNIIVKEEHIADAEDAGKPIKGGRIPFGNKIYRYIFATMDDPSYTKGDIISIAELASSPKVFNGRANSEAKLKQREMKVRKALPSVIHAFNYYWGANSAATVKMALIQATDRSTGKVLGVMYPMTTEDAEAYLAKLNARCQIAEEVRTIAEVAILMLPNSPIKAALPQPKDDKTAQ